jgi:glycosyltransferase involved in cell wall biosynthesis
VLSQAPRPEEIQIEVIDDCSTKDDPEAVVREVGKACVVFHRKPKNEGAIANFNTCIERSRGELVHILPGDDWILPDFYKTIEQTAEKFPDCALYAARQFSLMKLTSFRA